MNSFSQQTTSYSQPKDTGSGKHWGTQLLYAINYLKVISYHIILITHHDQSHPNPIRLQDLAIHSNLPQLESNHELYRQFKQHERVLYDENTSTFSYKVTTPPPWLYSPLNSQISNFELHQIYILFYYVIHPEVV